MKKATIKAWAILLNGELAHFDDGKNYVFAKTKKEARVDLMTGAGYEIVPCTITLTLNPK